MEEKINNQKKEITMDDLATMVQKGFLGMEEKMDEGFKKVNEDIEELKSTTDRIEADLNKKVDVFTHRELEYRVEKLEKKLVGA